MTWRTKLRAVCLAGLVIVATAAGAQEPGTKSYPYWPSERAARLRELDEQLTELLRLSATADYLGQEEENARLMKQVAELQNEASRLRETPMSSTRSER